MFPHLKKFTGKSILSAVTALLFFLFSALCCAKQGGVYIQGTRIIYPLNSQQQGVSVVNSSRNGSYLVQSWVENASGHKTNDFLVTPPLYLSEPGNENILRVIRSVTSLPEDRESLYYFVMKRIPSFSDKKDLDSTIIRIAAASRIKLFVRPANLPLTVDMAPSAISFSRSGRNVIIKNPTPYYVTMTKISIGGHYIKDVMVAPFGRSDEIPLPAGGDSVWFRTINDYGAESREFTSPLK